MKKLITLLLLSLMFSCDNKKERCEMLHVKYAEAIRNANGHEYALKNVLRKYEEDKERIGCK